jgi:hypothetical protein
MVTGLAFVLFAALFLGCTGLVVVGVFLWIRHWKDQRKTMFAALAARLGFRYVEPPAQSIGEGLAQIGQLLRSDPSDALIFSRYGLHGPTALERWPHIEGRSGDTVVRLGDTSALGDDNSDAPSGAVTIAMAEDPRLELPTFSVAPRTPLGTPRTTPIAFPEDPEFDSRFWVCGPDTATVRAQLSEKVRREITARGHQYWQGHGRTFAATREVVLDAREAEALLLDVRAVVTLLLPSAAG